MDKFSTGNGGGGGGGGGVGGGGGDDDDDDDDDDIYYKKKKEEEEDSSNNAAKPKGGCIYILSILDINCQYLICCVKSFEIVSPSNQCVVWITNDNRGSQMFTMNFSVLVCEICDGKIGCAMSFASWHFANVHQYISVPKLNNTDQHGCMSQPQFLVRAVPLTRCVVVLYMYSFQPSYKNMNGAYLFICCLILFSSLCRLWKLRR